MDKSLATMLKSTLANYGAPLERLRLNSVMHENDIAQSVALAVQTLEHTKAFEALALISEIAALDRDYNDEFGDVILDGTTDLFYRIQECAK